MMRTGTERGEGFASDYRKRIRRPALQLLLACSAAFACGEGAPGSVGGLDEKASQGSELLSPSVMARVLNYEGSMGANGDVDWTAEAGTAVAASTIRVEGAQSMSLTGGAPAAVSRALSSLGPVANAATVQIGLPASFQGLGWLGQVSLSLNAPSAGIYSQYAGPTPLTSQAVGAFHKYSITLPANVVSSLSSATYEDLRVTVRVELPQSGTVLVDELSFGNGLGGTGGVGGVGGAGGGGGSGGSGNTGDTAGKGGSSGVGGGGGASGASGAAGSGGSSGAESALFFFKLPNGIRPSDVALATTGGPITIDDSVHVTAGIGGFSSISAVENPSGPLNRIGVNAHVENVWNEGIVFLASQGTIHGSVRSSQSVELQDATSRVLGSIEEEADLRPLGAVQWEVQFPAQTQGDVQLEPNQQRTLAPGAWGHLAVKQGARLHFGPGFYTFSSMTVEPAGVLEIDNSAPVSLYSQTSFTFRGVVDRAQPISNVLFGVWGSSPVIIDASFRGIVVAPNAAVSLATTTQGHFGSVFAKQIIHHQSTSFVQEPFGSSDTCLPHCTGKQCGDDPADGCGGLCAHLCDEGEAGCESDLDCPSGATCAKGLGPCFGFESGTNVCWNVACSKLDPSRSDLGLPAGVSCGQACNFLGGAADGPCQAGQTRMPDGSCGIALANLSESGEDFPIPLTPLPTDEAGSVRGTFRVTDAGTAQYSVPIDVPPGRGDVAPTLALTYTSNKTNGMMGLGWVLSGLSTITRCQRILDRDGVAAKVDYTSNDRYCLDGQPLVEVAREFLPGSVISREYRTEIDSITRITSVEQEIVNPPPGPFAFQVFAKDGRIMRYGGPEHAVLRANTVARVWALSRVDDRSGNSMQIKYRQAAAFGTSRVKVLGTENSVDVRFDLISTGGELLPDTISYVEDDVQAETRRYHRFVKFVYEGRPQFDWVRNYSAGAFGLSSERLKRIETFVDNELVKRYALSYQQNRADQQTRLISVDECTPDGTCKVPTHFQYYEAGNFEPAQTLPDIPLGEPRTSGNTHTRHGAIVLDADGDGADDVLAYRSCDQTANSAPCMTPPAWQLTLGEWKGFQRPLATRVLDATGAAKEPDETCFNSHSVVDVNRDKRDDIVDRCTGIAYLGNGFGTFRALAEDAGLLVQEPASARPTGYLADVDGDGLKDFVGCQSFGSSCETTSWNAGNQCGRNGPCQLITGTTTICLNSRSHTLRVFRNKGSFGAGSFFEDTSQTVTGSGACKYLMPMDTDGNGTDELVQLYPAHDGPAAPSGPLEVKQEARGAVAIDVNGDGLKDLFNPPNLWTNTGDGFEPIAVSVTPDGPLPTLEHAQVLDYDGDGREDLLTSGAVYRFVAPGRMERVPVDFGATEGVVADLNGDGSMDLVLRSRREGGLSYRLSGRAGRAGLLSRVQEAFGKRIDIDYDAARGVFNQETLVTTYDASDCQSDNFNFKTTCVRRVAPLVSRHAESQVSAAGTKPAAEYRYRYEDARVGMRGRGYFGFGSRTEDLVGLTRTRLTYRNDDFLFAGRLSVSERVFSNDVPGNSYAQAVSSRTETATYFWGVQQGDHTRFPYIQNEAHGVAEGGTGANVYATKVGRTVDQYGTTTTMSVETLAADTVTIAFNIVDDMENRTDEWLLGLVKRTTTRSRRDLETRERHMSFDYDELGRMRSATREADTPESTTYRKTTLERDGFGNVQRTCVREKHGAAFERCDEVVEFDALHLFPRTTTNLENLTTTTHYSPRTGQVLVALDPNQRLSEFAYDGFGRLQQVLTPTSEGSIRYGAEGPIPTDFPELMRWSGLVVETDFKGMGTTKRWLDAFDRPVAEETPGFGGARVKTEYEYDALGRLARATLPHLPGDSSQGMIRYGYDGFGRLSEIRFPDDSTTRYAYPNRFTSTVAQWFADPASATATVLQKPRGNIDLVVRDPYGKPIRSSQAARFADLTDTSEIVTRYAYGAFDILKEVRGPLGVTTIEPDILGRMIRLHDPALGTRTFVHNGFDELETLTDANGRTTTRHYDRLGRMRELEDTDGALLARWIYDGSGPNEKGRLVAEFRQSKPGSTTGNWTRYGFQNRGLLETLEVGIGGTASDATSGASVALELTYESAVPWRVNTLRYPDAAGQTFAVEYEYDTSTGVLMSAHPAGINNPDLAYWRMLEADQGTRLKSERFGNGIVTTRSYYAPGCGMGADFSCMPGKVATIVSQRENVSTLPVQNERFAYDRNGNLAWQKFNDLSPIRDIYSYDGFDRLRFHDQFTPSGTFRQQTFDYDPSGNFVSKSLVGAYTYDPAHPFQVTSAGGVTFHYDANGNQTERIEDNPTGSLVPRGRQVLDYNDFDMPWRITSGIGSAAVATELEYGASGARLSKRELASGSEQTTKLTLDIAEMYRQVSDFASGVLAKRTHHYRIFAAGRQVAEVTKVERDGAINATETKTHFLHEDEVGSSKAITGADGELASVRVFRPFGEERSPIDWQSTGVASGFTGHQHDPELGLVNMRGRIYDPRLGRFLTPDPYVTEPLDPQGLNRYAYVQNNPLTFTDPTGFQCSGYGSNESGCWDIGSQASAQASQQAAGQAAAAAAAATSKAMRTQERAAAQAQSQAASHAQQEASSRAAQAALQGLGQAAQAPVTTGSREADRRMHEAIAQGMSQPAINVPTSRIPRPQAPYTPSTTAQPIVEADPDKIPYVLEQNPVDKTQPADPGPPIPVPKVPGIAIGLNGQAGVAPFLGPIWGVGGGYWIDLAGRSGPYFGGTATAGGGAALAGGVQLTVFSSREALDGGSLGFEVSTPTKFGGAAVSTPGVVASWSPGFLDVGLAGFGGVQLGATKTWQWTGPSP